jgi:hypothetical protein
MARNKEARGFRTGQDAGWVEATVGGASADAADPVDSGGIRGCRKDGFIMSVAGAILLLVVYRLFHHSAA